MTQYIKDGQYYHGGSVVIGDRRYISPSEAKLLALGYRKVVEDAQVSEPSKAERVWELKARLAESDYKALKFAEGWISAEEYAPIKAERQALRDEINELEAEDGE
ncbi:MAG: hypothetical protein J6X70_04355 [Muribaculaceae bacterium]|nr:hypothetical protein [Muribaculaceae bacterium]